MGRIDLLAACFDEKERCATNRHRQIFSHGRRPNTTEVNKLGVAVRAFASSAARRLTG